MMNNTPHVLTRRVFFWIAGLFAALPLQAQLPRDFVVDLSATVSTNTPCISLAWTQRRQGNITAQRIHRRPKGESVWVKQADLTTNQTSYADVTAVPFAEYEYWMERTFSTISPYTAIGYLSAGVRVPATEHRGKLLLVVDSTMAAPLAPEIAQLQADLTGDGWTVLTLTAQRTNSAASVKAQIKAAYDDDPSNVKMVYLLGHVPVPYSGSYAPDGHDTHVGAWPADGYYGDMTGTWTDTSISNLSASDPRNRNVPGDGKFDQSAFPALLKLMVGRVDMQGMTRAPSSAASETSLLRRYLRKAHDFRLKQGAYAAIPRRSMIRDDFGNAYNEAMAATGWAWAFTGAGASVDEVPSGQWFTASYAGGKGYLVGYGNGAGSYDGASSVGNTIDFGLKTSRVVFTSLFGSYFGDWDSGDNFLRAPLAGNATGDSLGLACFWAARPHWFTQHLGLGETLGYCALASQNNGQTGGGGYTPPGSNSRGVHIGLMGDPALRLHAVEPPRNLSASSASTQIKLTWTASTETNLLGYFVYRANTASGPFTRLTAEAQTTNAYSDATVTAGQTYAYLVRTLILETVPGGSYQNLSVGPILTLTASAGGTAAPGNPASLSVVQSSSTNAWLAWTDNATNETGFRIERKINAGGSYMTVGTVGANVTNVTDPGAFTHGSTYYYRVIATGTTGESLPSDEASFEASAGFFNLPSTLMKVSKAAGAATITVNRFGGVTGAASVNFATLDSSAFSGTHYTAATGTLTWADGEIGAKTISVPIINTPAPQAARQFKVTLSVPSSGTGLSINSSVAVLIEDPTATLEAPWNQTIIGGITDSSAAVLADQTFSSVTVGGYGLDSSATGEAGHFIYQNREGDGVLTAFFPSGIPSDNGARVALMVRASTANNAIMAAAATSSSASFGSLLSTRSATDAQAIVLPASANALTLARWMRLTRNGSVFTAETSADGSAWTLLGAVSLNSLPSSALWGIFHFSSDWSVTGLGNYHFAQAQNVTLTGLPAPSTPTNLTASATSPDAVTLTWAAVSGASGYRIERSNESGSFVQVADLIAGTGAGMTYVDTALTADTAYSYRVTSYNSSGSSSPCPALFAATPPPDIVSTLTTDDAGAADATVQRNLSSVQLGTLTNLTVAAKDDSWALLTNAAKVYLRFNLTGIGTLATAKLKLAFSGSSFFEDVGYYHMYPVLLSESADTWDETSITWLNAPQNNLTGVGFTGSYTLVGLNDDLFELPSPGAVVAFDLSAAVLNTNRGPNSLITIALTDYKAGALMEWASREHPDYAPPSLEIGVCSPLPNRASYLTATPGTGLRVLLRWADNAANETGFEVERSAGGGAFSNLQTVASNTVSFTDSTTLPEVTYAYRVRAINASGASSWTPVATITTPDVFHAGGTLWDAGGVNTLVDTPANWDFDLCPEFDGSDYYNFGTGGSVATVNRNIAFLGFNISRDADFTLADGGGVLTLGSSGLRAVAPTATNRTYTLAAGLVLATNQSWGVTNTGAGVTTLIVSGPISDGASSFGIAKSGSGVIALSGNSSYDGLTSVATGGVLRVSHGNALGSTNGSTTVALGAWLEVSENVAVPEPLTLTADGSPNLGGNLRSTGGTNVWSGRLTQTGVSRLRAQTGSRLALSGGVSGGYNLYLLADAGAELAVSGSPLNLGSTASTRMLYANGAGCVSLGSVSNVFGTLELAGLTVRADVAGALPSTSVLSLGSGYSPDGTFDLNGYSQTVSQLKRGITSLGTRVVTSSAPATLTVNGSLSPTYDGKFAGALSLIKAGSSTLTLMTNNTYTGETTVSGGMLTVILTSNLGSSSNIAVTAGTLKLQTSNGIPDTATVRITGTGKLRLEVGTETVGALYLGSVLQAAGTWGATGSGAAHINDTYLQGTGVLAVATGEVPGVSVTQSGGDTAVAEGGATDTYTVVLRTPPTAAVTVTINVGSQLSASPTNLIFTTANWNTEQTVTVAAVNDMVCEGPHSATVIHSASSADSDYNAISISGVPSAIADNDPQFLVLSTNALTVIEGRTTNLMVRLAAQPTNTLAVSYVWVSGDTDLHVSTGASLTFTTSNWSEAQAVTLVAAEDDGETANGAAWFISSAFGCNSVTVTVTEADDDFMLTVTTNGNGTASGGGIKDRDFAPYALAATPSTGSTFLCWSGPDAGSVANTNAASTTMSVSAAAFVTANFALAQKTLTVVSAHGGAQPGTVSADWGTALSQWVTNSPVVNGATQYVCIGASVAGNGFEQADATNIALILTNNASLTWHWRTNYWFDCVAEGSGFVSGSTSGWYAADSAISVTATGDNTHRFTAWTGDILAAQTNENPLVLTLDAPRSVSAHFTPITLVTPLGTPYSWLDEYGLVTGGDYENADLTDTDGDGQTASQEYVAGTVPTNALSAFRAALSQIDGQMLIHWTPDLTNAEPARIYSVYGTSSLLNGFPATPATNLPAGAPVPVQSLAPSRFFKVGVSLQP